MDNKKYCNLLVWNKAIDLVELIYVVTSLFPKEEIYSLTNQIRRAAVSIPSNLAEGASRSSLKEQIHFIEIAFGSLNELMCQLEISYSLNYITSEQLERVETQVKIVAQLMSGLKKSKEQELAK